MTRTVFELKEIFYLKRIMIFSLRKNIRLFKFFKIRFDLYEMLELNEEHFQLCW